MMTIETYTHNGTPEDDAIYEMIRDWSPDTISPIPLLPKRGVIVRDESGEALCFLAADMSNSTPRAFIGHLQTNPDAPNMKRFRAVKLAEKFLTDRLIEDGFIEIILMTKFPALACLSQRMGYHVFDTPVILATKNIA